MPQLIVNCPQCQRQLRVTESLLGKKVKCPSCGTVFTADAPEENLPTAPFVEGDETAGQAARKAPKPAGELYEVAPVEPSRRPPALEEDDYEDDYEDEDYDDGRRPRRRRLRRDYVPHRGAVILTLGIVGFFCFGIILGPIAWILGTNDLREMRAGRMDPAGEGLTQAGRICGIIVTVLTVLVCTVYGFMMVAGGMAGRFR
jgi:predicted Zn finger-like uncharacterized protein